MAGQVEEIKALKESCHVRVSHIMREGNKLADDLANYALDSGSTEAYDFAKLNIEGRRIVNSDKLLCPCLRVKVVRN